MALDRSADKFRPVLGLVDQPSTVSDRMDRAGWQNLESEKLNAQSIKCGGFWRAPELTVTNLSAELGGGWLDAGARLNVDTREFAFTNSSCFDPRAIAALLTEKTQNWLAQFSWTQPPALQAGGSLILPAWTNRQPDWRGEVQPTVRLAGEFAATNGAFRGIAVDSAQGNFSYSNLVWRLPHLDRNAPRRRSSPSPTSRMTPPKDYHWHVQGALAPDALRPLAGLKPCRAGPGTFSRSPSRCFWTRTCGAVCMTTTALAPRDTWR